MYVENRAPSDKDPSSSRRSRTQRRTRLVSLFGAAALTAAACGSAAEVAVPSDQTATGQAATSAVEADSGQEQAESAGQEAVPASLLSGEFETIAGSSIDLASLQGEDVVLWFWAPW